MATTVPTVVAGAKGTAVWGNNVAAAVDELQTAVPENWTTWASPTIAGLTKGNGTEVASHYTLSNSVVFCYYRFVLGTTSAVTGDLLLTTPTTHVHGSVTGVGYFEDVSAGRRNTFPVHSAGTTQALLRPQATDLMVTSICSVRMSSPQSVSNNLNTTFSFDTEDIDSRGWHTGGNPTRITPDVAGWVEVTYSTDWQSDTDYTRVLVQLLQNGGATTPLRSFDIVGWGTATPNLSGAFPPIQMNGTTDYLELSGFQTNTSAGANTCDAIFTAKLIQPTATTGEFVFASGATAATVPFTWTATDEIVAMFSYRTV